MSETRGRKQDSQDWSKLKQVKKDKCLKLLHLYMMVFKHYQKTKTKIDFTKNVLSKDVTDGVDLETSAKGSLLNKDIGLVPSSQYEAIRKRLRNSKMTAFDTQYRILKDLEWISAETLWGAMNVKHELEYEQASKLSYMDVWKICSPWLFKERNLDDPSEDMIYRLLTAAIFISVNQQTSSDDEQKDELDILCERYLDEELPEFSLRTLFDTLFSDHRMFAVKQGDHYVAVDSGSLTDLDRVKILFPNNNLQHSFTPEEKEDAQKAKKDAQRLLDNQIDQETTRQVLGFFECYGANAWSLLVSHLLETFVRCQFVSDMRHNGIKNKQKIEDALSEMSYKDYIKFAEVFRNRLDDEDGNNVCWISDVCDSFWGGVRAASSLPLEAKDEFGAQKLFDCIAAYILIAVYCLKMEGDAVPEKRRRFRRKLEAQIRDVFFGTNQGSAELLREKDQKIQEKDREIAQLKQDLNTERTEKENAKSTIDILMAFLTRYLNAWPQNLPMEEIQKIFSHVNGYDDPKRRRLKNDSDNWGDGGIE